MVERAEEGGFSEVEEEGGMFSLLDSSESMVRLVGLEKFLGIGKVVFGFPGVFCSRISLPFYKKGVSSSLPSVGGYGFYFVLRLSFDKVRWGLRE